MISFDDDGRAGLLNCWDIRKSNLVIHVMSITKTPIDTGITHSGGRSSDALYRCGKCSHYNSKTLMSKASHFKPIK